MSKEEHSPHYRLQRRVNIVLALVLTPLAMASIPAFVYAGYLWHKHPNSEAGPWMVYLACLVVATVAALAWALRNLHFIFAYGKWPMHAGPFDDPRVWPAAREAFFSGDFQHSLSLMERFGPEPQQGAVRLAQGRALAWLGRMDEAAIEIEASRLDQGSLRWLKAQRRFGLFEGVYFSSEAPERATRLSGLLLLFGSILISLGFGAGFGMEKAQKVLQLVSQPYFDGRNFQVERFGSFTFHYHDPTFRDQILAVAEDALRYDLAALELPRETFSEGQIQLYLCDSREEYRHRAPFSPAWEAGAAERSTMSIYLFRDPRSSKIQDDILVAHELSHLCFAKIANRDQEDSWLDEGLAEYLGFKYALDKAGFARQAWIKENLFKGLSEGHIPFQQFFSMSPRRLTDTAMVSTFYMQGFSVVTVLAENYGEAPLNAFIRLYGRGAAMDRALASAFPSLPNTDALSAVWGLFYRNQDGETSIK